jgi:hypothetical protein
VQGGRRLGQEFGALATGKFHTGEEDPGGGIQEAKLGPAGGRLAALEDEERPAMEPWGGEQAGGLDLPTEPSGVGIESPEAREARKGRREHESGEARDERGCGIHGARGKGEEFGAGGSGGGTKSGDGGPGHPVEAAVGGFDFEMPFVGPHQDALEGGAVAEEDPVLDPGQGGEDPRGHGVSLPGGELDSEGPVRYKVSS